MPSRANEAPRILCGTAKCQTLHVRWTAMASAGAEWQDMVCEECEACRTERARRNRLMEAADPRVHREPFLRAPYVHQNNTPTYHAMLLRAVEEAKRGTDGAKHILWVRAQDRPHNPKEIAKNPALVDEKRNRFLQKNDQHTAGIPGLLPLYMGMQVRVTENWQRDNGSRSSSIRLARLWDGTCIQEIAYKQWARNGC